MTRKGKEKGGQACQKRTGPKEGDHFLNNFEYLIPSGLMARLIDFCVLVSASKKKKNR